MTNNKSPKDIAEKWRRRATASVEDYKSGINAVDEAPSQKAIKKKEKMKQNLIKSIDDGTWEQRLGAVTLTDWKNKTIEKGANRYSGGVSASQPKMEKFMEELVPFQEQLKSKIDNMPDITLEDSINRASEWIRGMANFKKKR